MFQTKVLPQFTAELPLVPRPRQKFYREAVSKVIRDLKSDYGLSNTALAEEIGCCDETISNAENENNDLSAVILLRVAFHFGEAAIDPVRQLYLCRHDPARRSVADRLRDLLADMEAA